MFHFHPQNIGRAKQKLMDDGFSVVVQYLISKTLRYFSTNVTPTFCYLVLFKAFRLKQTNPVCKKQQIDREISICGLLRVLNKRRCKRHT